MESNNPKRVLIITYYWPPSGGSGVQRWLKMSKYLPENGWIPVIYTPENPEYPVEDLSLLNDVSPETVVIKFPIAEPYSYYKKFLNIDKEQKIKTGFLDNKNRKSWKKSLSVWIRGNLFIPDSRCLWIRPSVRYLKRYLNTNPVDAIISTGPPHSMHLIAEKLHKATGIPWMADFRDPWTEIYYFDDLRLTSPARWWHRRLERRVLSNATRVVTVSAGCASDLEALGKRGVDVVTNGFDTTCPTDIAPSAKFTVAHIGILPPRVNSLIWRAIAELINENDDFRRLAELKLIGEVDHEHYLQLEKLGVLPNTTIISYMPHSEIVREQKTAQVLLLLIARANKNRGIVSGKLFEYLAVQRPIVMVGPADGDAAQIIAETQSGVAVDYDDIDGIKNALLHLFEQYRQGERAETKSSNIEQYSRRNLAAKAARLLDEML